MYHNVFPFLLHKMLRKKKTNKKKKKKVEAWMEWAKGDTENLVKNKVTDEFCPFPTVCLYVFD